MQWESHSLIWRFTLSEVLIPSKYSTRERNKHYSMLAAVDLRHCTRSRKVAGSIPDGVIRNFSLTQSFRPHYNPRVDSASNRNEYQEYFVGGEVKAAGAYGWQPYHLHVPIVLKSGSLNLLEPSGLVQACNGIALPLPFCFRRAVPNEKENAWCGGRVVTAPQTLDSFLFGTEVSPNVVLSQSVSLHGNSWAFHIPYPRSCWSSILVFYFCFRPIPVAARSEACVCGRLLAGIEGLNPNGGMDIFLFSMLCVVR